jgi:AraC-like DNA-binding protein
MHMVDAKSCLPPFHGCCTELPVEVLAVGEIGLSVGSRSAFPRPEWRRSWVLGCLERGRLDLALPQGLVELQAGWGLVIPPGERLERIDQVPASSCLRWLVVDEALWCAQLPVATEWLRTIRRTGLRSFPIGDGWKMAHSQLRAALDRNDHTAPDEIRAHLVLLTCILLRGVTAWAHPRRISHARCGDAVVDEALSHLRARLHDLPSVDALAARFDLSTSQLYRRFRVELGIGPKPLMQQLRLDRARELLIQGTAVNQIAAQVSLGTTEELRRMFRRGLGCEPERWLVQYAPHWGPSRAWRSGLQPSDRSNLEPIAAAKE